MSCGGQASLMELTRRSSMTVSHSSCSTSRTCMVVAADSKHGHSTLPKQRVLLLLSLLEECVVHRTRGSDATHVLSMCYVLALEEPSRGRWADRNGRRLPFTLTRVERCRSGTDFCLKCLLANDGTTPPSRHSASQCKFTCDHVRDIYFMAVRGGQRCDEDISHFRALQS